METLLAGGDDYEILCAIPEGRYEAFAQDARKAGVAVTPIGTVIAGNVDFPLPRRRRAGNLR